MQAQSTQIRVTLPVQLESFLQSKASKFGLSLSAYVKNLIINDVKHMDFPEFPISKKTEDVFTQALVDYQQGKAEVVEDINEFLETL